MGMCLNPKNRWYHHPLSRTPWFRKKQVSLEDKVVWRIFTHPEIPVEGYSATRLLNPEDWQEILFKVTKDSFEVER